MSGLAAASLQQLLAAIAEWAALSAADSLQAVLTALGPQTEPDFRAIEGTYGRMLTVALLLLAVVIAAALAEELLGGAKGAGWSVVPRAIVACAMAASGLQLVAYATAAVGTLTSAFSSGIHSQSVTLRVLALSSDGASGQAATGALLATSVLILILAALLYLELVLRAAIVMVVVVFLPLTAVAWIWPRLASAFGHLLEFLGGLLMTKFVAATVVYTGCTLLLNGLGTRSGQDSGSLVAAVTVLAIAVFSPLLVWRALRFTHGEAGVLARSWAATASHKRGRLRAPLRRLVRDGRRAWKSWADQ